MRQTHVPAETAQAWRTEEHGNAFVIALAAAGEFAVDLPRFGALRGALIDALLMPGCADAWPDTAARLRARRAALGGEWEVFSNPNDAVADVLGGEEGGHPPVGLAVVVIDIEKYW